MKPIETSESRYLMSLSPCVCVFGRSKPAISVCSVGSVLRGRPLLRRVPMPKYRARVDQASLCCVVDI